MSQRRADLSRPYVGSTPSDDLCALGWALSLVHPLERVEEDLSREFGNRGLQVAIDERIAAVAWERSGPYIRRVCHPDTVSAWRGTALGFDRMTRRQAAALVELLAVLEAARIPAVVLKGLPLSMMLYGTPSARASMDLDIYIKAADQARAAILLEGAGWQHSLGKPPGDVSFTRVAGDMLLVLEMHVRLGDELLMTTELDEREVTPVEISPGVAVPALSGLSLPGYLAVHIAKHVAGAHRIPLLWYLDLLVRWEGLSHEERLEAWSLARRGGGARWLRWALRRAQDIRRAASGDGAALRRVARLRERHSRVVFRLARLGLNAASPRVALVLLGRWLFPVATRGTITGALVQVVERATKGVVSR